MYFFVDFFDDFYEFVVEYEWCWLGEEVVVDVEIGVVDCG